jgi:hypothetical protein
MAREHSSNRKAHLFSSKDELRLAVQTKIGEELGKQYELPQKLPRELLLLLMQLNEQDV